MIAPEVQEWLAKCPDRVAEVSQTRGKDRFRWRVTVGIRHLDGMLRDRVVLAKTWVISAEGMAETSKAASILALEKLQQLVR